MSKWTIIVKDGLPLMVIRPKDPVMALRIAKIAFEKQDMDLLDRLPNEVGADSYTFLGYAAQDKKGKSAIVTKDGVWVGTLEPGDSFVTKSEAS
jgi:hypothetical protein